MTAAEYRAARIHLTPRQREWVEWALDPMADFWCSTEGARERGEDAVYDEADLPRLDGKHLVVSAIADINADLLYRLQVQAPQVAEGADTDQAASGAARAAMGVATKLADAVPGLTPHGS